MRIVKVVLMVFFCISGLTVAEVANIPEENIDYLMKYTRFAKEEFTLFPDCKLTDTCDLEAVRFMNRDYIISEMDGSDPSYGASMFAEYETKSHRTLEKYVFVQFIRGCLFSSEIKDGKIVIGHSWSKEYNGKYIPFFFKDWTVDTSDTDPVYSSMNDPNAGRHFLYQHLMTGMVFPKTQGNLYGEKKPIFPRLFVTDTPSQGWMTPSDSAHNVSLEFQICLHKASDVPKITSLKGEGIKNPIACHNWRSSQIYDHELKAFTSPNKIVDACLKPK